MCLLHELTRFFEEDLIELINFSIWSLYNLFKEMEWEFYCVNETFEDMFREIEVNKWFGTYEKKSRKTKIDT
ncbi:hypothetical protein RJT34_30626 [Clitoria ternatea]|uniref:Uncharacterized protein n=1 Tax=Clitoria ternatea TaxID=43366 RepID=A0AAN9ESR9_CLITE